VTAVTIWEFRAKKELDFPRNKPKLNIPPRPGPGSSGRPASGSSSTPGAGSPPLNLSPFFDFGSSAAPQFCSSWCTAGLPAFVFSRSSGCAPSARHRPAYPGWPHDSFWLAGHSPTTPLSHTPRHSNAYHPEPRAKDPRLPLSASRCATSESAANRRERSNGKAPGHRNLAAYFREELSHARADGKLPALLGLADARPIGNGGQV